MTSEADDDLEEKALGCKLLREDDEGGDARETKKYTLVAGT